jgi:hypothetical protein
LESYNKEGTDKGTGARFSLFPLVRSTTRKEEKKEGERRGRLFVVLFRLVPVGNRTKRKAATKRKKKEKRKKHQGGAFSCVSEKRFFT